MRPRFEWQEVLAKKFGLRMVQYNPEGEIVKVFYLSCENPTHSQWSQLIVEIAQILKVCCG